MHMMSNNETNTGTTAATIIPTIRLDDTNVDELVQTLRSACINVGFFYLDSHGGIRPSLVDKVMHQMKRLFDLPISEKKALSDSILNRGYTSFEEEILDPTNQNKGDTKEGFYICKDVSVDSIDYNPAKLSGPNQWPTVETSPSMTQSECDEFKTVLQEYFEECKKVGFRLQRLLALAIGLEDENYWDDAYNDPLVTLRLLHYSPEQSIPEEGVFACGAHSDYGVLTLLLTDDMPGLQIYLHQTDEWMDVPPRPNAFIVNLGDMLERWTNGLFRSTLHRVVTIDAGDEETNRERYSLPCFYDPNFDTHVQCLDICCNETSNPPKYPPTTTGQHLLDKFKETHTDFEPSES